MRNVRNAEAQEQLKKLHLVRISEYPVELPKLLMHLFVCELFMTQHAMPTLSFHPSWLLCFLVLASWHKLASSPSPLPGWLAPLAPGGRPS